MFWHNLIINLSFINAANFAIFRLNHEKKLTDFLHTLLDHLDTLFGFFIYMMIFEFGFGCFFEFSKFILTVSLTFISFFYKNQQLQKMKLKQKTYNSALTIILCVLMGKTKNGKYKL